MIDRDQHYSVWVHLQTANHDYTPDYRYTKTTWSSANHQPTTALAKKKHGSGFAFISPIFLPHFFAVENQLFFWLRETMKHSPASPKVTTVFREKQVEKNIRHRFTAITAGQTRMDARMQHTHTHTQRDQRTAMHRCRGMCTKTYTATQAQEQSAIVAAEGMYEKDVALMLLWRHTVSTRDTK